MTVAAEGAGGGDIEMGITGTPAATRPNKTTLASVLPRWWRLAAIWFTGEERWIARGYAAAVITLAFLTTLFYVKISYAQKNFSTALSGKDVSGFYSAVGDFVVIICIAAPFFAFTGWVEDRLVLQWRAYLTKVFLAAYFQDQAYFRIRQTADALQHESLGGGRHPGAGAGHGGGSGHHGSKQQSGWTASVLGGGEEDSIAETAGRPELIDNPDQRICDDVAAFVRSSTSIALSLLKKTFNVVAFAGVLWGVSGQLVAFMFIYAAVGTFMTTAMFGRILMQLYYAILAREGDLRYVLVRVREAAESIAFYKGERAEAAVVSDRLGAVIHTSISRIKWAALYDLWTSVYNYATILAPSLLTAPRYFKGEIEFGTISQASYAFSSIESALSIIINNLAAITGLAAETERLDALLTAMARHHHLEQALTAASAGAASSGPRSPANSFKLGSKGPGLEGDVAKGGSEASLTSPLVAGDLAKSSVSSLTAGGGASSSHMALGVPVLLRTVPHFTLSRQQQIESLGMLALHGGAPSLISRNLVPDMQGLRLERLSVMLPGSLRPICSGLDLELRPGESLLIVGPSGCGKSSLLRALAGLWREGAGSILMPTSTFFLPQKAFMPIGTLKHQLLFPAGADIDHPTPLDSSSPAPAGSAAGRHGTSTSAQDLADRDTEMSPLLGGSKQQQQGVGHRAGIFSRGGGGGAEGGGVNITARAGSPLPGELPVSVGGFEAPPPVRGGAAAGDGDVAQRLRSMPDEELQSLLASVNLGDLVEKAGGWESERDWSHVLSSGEQQRLAFVRLLLHAPHLAFLDESTSAVDMATETILYEQLRSSGIQCFVSVGHRPQLLRFHTHVLECRVHPDGAREWVRLTSAEYQAQLARSNPVALYAP